jgi:hypothetical protein
MELLRGSSCGKANYHQDVDNYYRDNAHCNSPHDDSGDYYICPWTVSHPDRLDINL